MAGVGSQIVVVDKNHQRAMAEADDIMHAVPFAHRIGVRELIKRVWAHTCNATLPDSARDALVE